MRALSVGALDFGAGEVCALSALCALSPFFTQFTEDLPHGWPVWSGGGAKLSKSCPPKRAPGRTPAHRSNYLLTLRPLTGLRVPSKKSYEAVLFNKAQLTIAKKCCSCQRGGEVFWALVLPLRWLRRHGTCGSVLSRAASPR